MRYSGLKQFVEDYVDARLATARTEFSKDPLSLLRGNYRLSIHDLGRSIDYEFSEYALQDLTQEQLGHQLDRLLCQIVVFPMPEGVAANFRRTLAMAMKENQRHHEREWEQHLIEESYDAL
jgi:hypothetical protein